MNDKAKQKRSLYGVELLRELANRGLRIFSIQDARDVAKSVGMKQAYILEALSLLKRSGWIEGIKRGLYAFTADSGMALSPHEFEIAQQLVPSSAISYWTAMRFFGMTQQLPNRIFSMVSSEVSIPRNLPNKHFQYVRIKREYFFGMKTVWIDDQTRICFTDPERTLLEGLRHPEYCGGFNEVLSAYESSISDLNITKLVGYALKLEVAVSKRLGWILESLGVDLTSITPLLDMPMKGPRKLDPSSSPQGVYIRKWQLQDNR